MTFYFSSKRLLTLLALRMILVVLSLFVALAGGEILWAFFGISALATVLELSIYASRGYAKITDTEIVLMDSPFGKKSVRIEEVYLTLSYNNEWTFRTKEKELRINRSFIRENQRKDFDAKLELIRVEVEKKKHLINR